MFDLIKYPIKLLVKRIAIYIHLLKKIIYKSYINRILLIKDFSIKGTTLSYHWAKNANE